MVTQGSEQRHTHRATVTLQGRLLRVQMQRLRLPGDQVRDDTRRKVGKRGVIADFTRRSRKRLLDLFARLDVAGRDNSMLTLTYPDAALPVTPRQSYKNHIRPLLERFRRAYPHMSAVLRKEVKIRQSGRFRGLPCPHWHVVLLNAPYVPREHLKAVWGELIGVADTDQLQVHIERLFSSRKLFQYVSKYVAKVDDGGGGEACLDTVPYLHAAAQWGPEIRALDWLPGRWWMVYNRAALPFAEVIEVVMDGFAATMRTIHQFRRYAAAYWRGLRRDRADVGFSLYIENPERWLDALFDCAVRL